jgi:hypothetical protein
VTKSATDGLASIPAWQQLLRYFRNGDFPAKC